MFLKSAVLILILAISVGIYIRVLDLEIYGQYFGLPFLALTIRRLIGWNEGGSSADGTVWPECPRDPFDDSRLIQYKHLAVLGHVFDVSESSQHYGSDGDYNKLTGKDASRALVTGDFSDQGLIDNVDGLSTAQLGEIFTWLEFFGKKYGCVGYMPGKFFEVFGEPTPYLSSLRKAAQDLAEERQSTLKAFPPCSSSTVADAVSFWCKQTTGDAELLRPRQFYEAGRVHPRCACVHPALLEDPRVREYSGCDPNSMLCETVPST